MNESRAKLVDSGRLRVARLLIAVAAAISATGVFLLGMGERDAGGTIVLVGWCGFVVALHAFGRLGPESK